MADEMVSRAALLRAVRQEDEAPREHAVTPSDDTPPPSLHEALADILSRLEGIARSQQRIEDQLGPGSKPLGADGHSSASTGADVMRPAMFEDGLSEAGAGGAAIGATDSIFGGPLPKALPPVRGLKKGLSRSRTFGPAAGGGVDKEWPKDIPIREYLLKEPRARSRNGRLHHMRVSERIISNLTQSQSGLASLRANLVDDLEVVLTGGGFKCWPLDPNSTGMIIFDLLGVLVLSYDIIFTPYIFALDIYVQGALKTLGYLATAYWSTDFLLRWITGFYRRGELHMKMRDIAMNYLATWCLFDVILLALDYLILLLQETSADVSGSLPSSTMRTLKLARMLKVARLTRLVQKMDKMSALSLSGNTRTLVQGFNILACVLIYNHLVCCTWVALGRSNIADMTWLDNLMHGRVTVGGGVLRDGDPLFIYLTSFHWTLAQMTPGPIDIVAVNIWEKMFNVVLLVIGLMFGSLIVSLFSGQIMQHVIKRRARMQQLETVRRFLRQHTVCTRIAIRVQRQVVDRLSMEAPLTYEDVGAFSVLSSGLKEDLMCEISWGHLQTHALFRVWADMEAKSLIRLCHKAVSHAFFSQQDILFAAQVGVDSAFFLAKGQLIYTQEYQETTFAVDPISPVTEVVHGTWFCEAALWAEWVTVGRMEADCPAQIMQISAAGVSQVMAECMVVGFVLRQYGVNYHRRVVAAAPPHSSYPTDLFVPFTEAASLLSFHVGLGLLQRGVNDGSVDLSPAVLEALKKEVREEQCTIHWADNNTLERIVSIVALRLTRVVDDDCFLLVRVGTFSREEGLSYRCDLPATKLAIGDSLQTAIHRVTEVELGGLCAGLEIEDMQTERYVETSKKFRMQTRYHKTTYHGTVLQPSDEASLTTLDVCGENCPIEERPVYVLKAEVPKSGSEEPEEGRLYAWLTEEEFQRLRTPEGKAAWQAWLGGAYMARAVSL